MVRSCWEGWMTGWQARPLYEPLWLVYMIQRGSSRFGCVVSGCSWWWFSVLSLGDFLGALSGPCSRGFDGWNLWEPFVVLWAVIPLPNQWVEWLDFGGFGVLGLEVLLRVDFRFLLIYQVLVDQIIAMGCPWGTPSIPEVLFESVERIRRSVVLRKKVSL
jgi:hypothetical protein